MRRLPLKAHILPHPDLQPPDCRGSRTKRTFSPEFRLEAIEQVVKYQRDVREVALALELNPDYLRKWIRLYKQELQGIEPAGNAITPEQREL